MAGASATVLSGDDLDHWNWHVSEAVLRLAFYNIGWGASDKHKGIEELQMELLGIVVDHQVQVLALCEVFEIDDGLNEELLILQKKNEIIKLQKDRASLMELTPYNLPYNPKYPAT